MNINTFWNLVLKILGLWFLFQSLYIFPQFISTLVYIDANDEFQSLFLSWGMLTIILIVYIIIFRILILKSDWMINKLKLDQKFTEDRMDLNIKSSTILAIAIIIIGGLVFIENLALLLKQLFEFFQQRNTFRQYARSSWIIFYLVNTVIGYLLFSNSRIIVDFIEKQSK